MLFSKTLAPYALVMLTFACAGRNAHVEAPIATPTSFFIPLESLRLEVERSSVGDLYNFNLYNGSEHTVSEIAITMKELDPTKKESKNPFLEKSKLPTIEKVFKIDGLSIRPKSGDAIQVDHTGIDFRDEFAGAELTEAKGYAP